MLSTANKNAILSALDPVVLGNRTCFLPNFKIFRGAHSVGGRCQKKVTYKAVKNNAIGSKMHFALLKEQLGEAANDQTVRQRVEQYIVNVSCNCHSESKLGAPFPMLLQQAVRTVEQRVAMFMLPTTPLNLAPPTPSTLASGSTFSFPSQLDTIGPVSPLPTQAPAQHPTPETSSPAAQHVCHHCLESFDSACDLFLHTASRHPLAGLLVCCDIGFDSSTALMQHRAERHAPVTSLMCCGASFATFESWMQHDEAFHLGLGTIMSDSDTLVGQAADGEDLFGALLSSTNEGM